MIRNSNYNLNVLKDMGKVRKVLRNRDGSRTFLISRKGWAGQKVWVTKSGKKLYTASHWMKG